MLDRILRLIRNPEYTFQYLLNRGDFKDIPDEKYLKLKFKHILGAELNLDRPLTFNEKLQWLKLYDRNPLYTQLVDKYKIREYIAKTIGEQYLIPLLGVYNHFEDIDFKKLPNQFVLKPNHTSGNIYICEDKTQIIFEDLKKEINLWLKRNYFWVHREWPYKNIKPRIICEKYLVDEYGKDLKDYKIMCFNGEPKIIQVMSERNNGRFLVNHFDLDWNELNIPRKSILRNPNIPKKPKDLKDMIEISKVLSKDIPFVRVDLYKTTYGLLFGEMTFFPVSGFMDFKKKKDDKFLGDWIDLPMKEINDRVQIS